MPGTEEHADEAKHKNVPTVKEQLALVFATCSCSVTVLCRKAAEYRNVAMPSSTS